jgi:uncharacterized membrane protein
MRLERNTPYWLLVVGAALFLGGALFAPWARSKGWVGGFLLYELYDPVCHQQAERSFHFFGHQAAVCHRCLGLYLGGLLSLLVVPRWSRLMTVLLDHPRLILAFVFPMGLDWLLFDFNVPASRFVTGFLASIPVGAFAWAALAELTSRPRRHPLQPEGEGL